MKNKQKIFPLLIVSALLLMSYFKIHNVYIGLLFTILIIIYSIFIFFKYRRIDAKKIIEVIFYCIISIGIFFYYFYSI